MRRILIIGGTGTIGQLIIAELGGRYEVITASPNRGDVKVDIRSRESLERMFHEVGEVDDLVTAAGQLHFGDIAEMTDEEFYIGIESKLMGQVNAVRLGLHHVRDRGSITVTSGCTNVDPVRHGSLSALVNGGLDGFVVGAALEMPRGIRLNGVSPGVLRESLARVESKFPGFQPVEGAHVAKAYRKCIEGLINGRVISVH